MTRLKVIVILANMMVISTFSVSLAQDDIEIWKKFVAILREGKFPKQMIRPYHESLREPLVGFLDQMRESASWQEWEASPEIYRVENQVHFLIPLSFENQKGTYCFSFVVDGTKWYFQHLEFITIRLDKVTSLPASRFPDLPEETKAWMRAEIRVSQQVRLFNLLAREKGREFALGWFKDGAGYALAARSWVPFFPIPRAFILYLCWEQSNLRGNEVTLELLDDRQAVVRMRPIYFDLFESSGHLKQQISFDDYRAIFETIWHDRARNAEWELTIKYGIKEIVLHFKKQE